MPLLNAEVDPFHLPYTMTPRQLEYWILFSVCVAGKGAAQTHKKLNAALCDMPSDRTSAYDSAFNRIQWADLIPRNLYNVLKKHKLGKYRLLLKAFRTIARLDISRIDIPMLEAVPGIGPKSARMIMLYSDPQANCVPLDTHILKYLAAQGIKDVPKSTPPSGPKYSKLERQFQLLARVQGKTVRELDTEVWNSYAKKPQVKCQLCPGGLSDGTCGHGDGW